MLEGAARKIVLPFVFLSLLGWITFGVGFGIRNFEYRDQSSGIVAPLDDAATHEFFFHWLYGVAAPFLLLMTIFHIFCYRRTTALSVFILLPAVLIGAGGVLFYDGLQIYEHYELGAGSDNDVVVILLDAYQAIRSQQQVDIHNEDKFVPIEFSGALAAVLFYWIYMLFMPFFVHRLGSYDDY